MRRLGLGPQAPLKAWELYLFTVHLHAMVRCGMGLVPALDVLSNSGDERSRRCAQQLLEDVEGGLKFSQALNRQPDSFPSTYIKIIQTAEETGKLVDCLDRLAQALNQQGQTARRLTGALFYPCFLFCASLAMVVAMVYMVFPMVLRVTQEVGVRPPALTRMLMVASSPFSLTLGLLALGGLGVLVRVGLRRPEWRRAGEALLPPGRFYVRLQILRSTRQLAIMLESGVDLLRSLGHSGQTGEGSLLVSEAYDEIVRQTRAGQSLAQCFAQQPVFPRSLPGMLAVCEETGLTHRMLHSFCDMLEEDLQGQVDAATSLLEPLMLAAMGVVIGVILIAAFMPIYQLIDLA